MRRGGEEEDFLQRERGSFCFFPGVLYSGLFEFYANGSSYEHGTCSVRSRGKIGENTKALEWGGGKRGSRAPMCVSLCVCVDVFIITRCYQTPLNARLLLCRCRRTTSWCGDAWDTHMLGGRAVDSGDGENDEGEGEGGAICWLSTTHYHHFHSRHCHLSQ